MFERFDIEALSTTESPLDDLRHHRKIKDSGWRGRVLTAFRPDPVVDPAFPGFLDNLAALAAVADADVSTWQGYLAALAKRRAYFKSVGCTSTDHGHPTAPHRRSLDGRSRRALRPRAQGRRIGSRRGSCSAPRC